VLHEELLRDDVLQDQLPSVAPPLLRSWPAPQRLLLR
jgi:hypothetical protein